MTHKQNQVATRAYLYTAYSETYLPLILFPSTETVLKC